MARPQPGIKSPPLAHSLVLIFNVRDMAMNAMSVGQFSVMVPGLVSDILKKWPGEQMVSTVGFGRMFWLLVWHTGIPRGFRDIDEEDLEGEARHLPVTGGDVMFYLSASRRELLDEVEASIRHNLKNLVDPVECFPSTGSIQYMGSSPASSDSFSHQIFIGSEDSDFSQGSFVWVQKWREAESSNTSMEIEWKRALQVTGNHEHFLPHALTRLEGAERETIFLTFYKDANRLETLLTDLLADEGIGQSAWLDSVSAITGAGFFLPSVDVLIGLRMGGIRMNRFSPTRQYD